MSTSGEALIPMEPQPVVKAKKAGVRERSKRERQDRIMMAARTMLAEQGYDATTLRQVAERAGLGLGTLFNYISDKRDLIYLRLQSMRPASPATLRWLRLGRGRALSKK